MNQTSVHYVKQRNTRCRELGFIANQNREKSYAIVRFCARKMRIGLLLKQLSLQLLLQGSLRVLRRRRRRRGVSAALAAADTLGGGAAAFAAAVDG